MLGGQTIQVAGPCFNDDDEIICVFDGIEARGIYATKFQALCISPPLSHTGRVPFELIVKDISYGETEFTSCE